MAVTIADLQTVTDDDLRAACRHGLLHAALSRSVTEGDRQVLRSKISELMKMHDWLDNQIAVTNDEHIGLVGFARAT